MNRFFLFWWLFPAAGCCYTLRAQPLAAWHFNLERTLADSGYAELEAVRTLSSFAAGTGSGKAWSLRAFAPQGTESGQRGWQLSANTLGMDSVWLTGLLRGSPTSSRWWRVEVSVDFGSTWTAVWATDTGWGPFDTWVPFRVPLVGAEGHARVEVRAVSVFAPVAFSNFGGSFGANQAYQGMRVNPASATQNYSTSGTWRWENLGVRGTESPPTVWNGQQWSMGAPDSLRNARVASSYLGAGFTCANLNVAAGAVLEVLPGGALDVRGRAVIDGTVLLDGDSLGTASLRVASAGWGSGHVYGSTFWPNAGWHQLASPLDHGVSGLTGLDSAQLYSWNADSGAYRPPGLGLGARGRGFFGSGSGSVGLHGPVARQPWRGWELGYAPGAAASSGVGFTTAVQDGWNLLGNPFWCGLDFSSLSRQGVDASYSIWNPALFGGLGGYEAYSPSGGSLSSVIPPLHGFWVRAQGSTASLESVNQGTLGSGAPPAPSLRLELRDAADSACTASVWLVPDAHAGLDLDFGHDGLQRPSPAPLRWSIEAANGDAFAKKWNPNLPLTLRSEVTQARTAVARCVGCAEPVYLVGETQVIALGEAGAPLTLDGTQHWQLTRSLGTPTNPHDRAPWRVGPGFIWAPEADELQIVNLVGQVVAHFPDACDAPRIHNLPHGLYVVRVRQGAQWTQRKTILTP
jgi:hypothetical protein